MLRASPPLSVSQASHYYRSEFSRGDYYTERQSEGIVASRWHGRGASQLGLSGRVKANDFARLLEGRDPSGKRVLVAHREGKDERRAGWDVTISPHKSVSLQALVGGDSRLLEAHDRAVAKAVCELERHAQAWVHGGRDVETTGLVIAGSFRHETSRALDPQLHSHCVLLNITRRSDGEWRAVDARGVFRAQRLAREIYESELRKELVSLGYKVQSYRDGRHGRDRAVGIAGFRDEHLKHFSKRSREIEKALQAGGLKSRLHGSRVTVATRAVKAKGIDREALLWNWRTTAREMAIEFPRADKARAVLDRHLGIGPDVELAARAAVNGAVSHLSERRTVFRVADLERDALASMRDQGVTIDDVRKEIATRRDLVMVDRQDAVVARVTTTQAIDQERALVDAAERARGRGAVIPSPGDARGLGDDQLRVARHVLESPDRLVAVEGKAGTGKSTTLAHVRERAEAAGFQVRGFAPTTTAAGVLREGGIDSTTVAALLKETPSLKGGRELWIVDEAGLLSTKQARELLDRAEQADAKLVLVGDRAQHRAVEAGSPFEVLIERGKVATERLDVIRRQRDEQLRDVVLAASERGGAALAVQLLEQRGRVVEIADPRQRHEQITRDFVADGGRGVVIAPSNAERIDLNHRIREALIESGQVERKSVKAKVVVKQDLTAEQKRRVSSFSDGDVLRFVRSGNGIGAGERGRVIGIDERKNRLWLEMEDLHVRVINPKERRAFEVERVQEKRFAVGDRIQFRARDRALDVANGTVGTIRKLDHVRGLATVEVGGRRFRMDLGEPRALDHAYAVTSHRSQGLSKERVYLAVDTSHSEELVNRRQFYVSVSRAVEEVRVYTDDRSALSRAVSREQGRESALQIADRAPAHESRTVALRRETALDLVRSHDDDERRGRQDGRALGSDRRSQGADRGRVAPGRGAEGAAGPARGAAGAERGRARGADRVPGPGDAGATRPSRAAGHEAERGPGPARAVPGRTRDADAVAPGRTGPAPGPGDVPARAVADGAGDRGGDGGRLPGRPDRDLSHQHEPAGRDRRGGHAEGQAHAQPQARALSKDAIAQSPNLRRLYAGEYASLLRVVPDRGLAKEAARVNVSALASGQLRIVPPEGRLAVEPLRDALGRGEDLAAIRRAVTRVIERAAPALERSRLPLVRDLGPER